MVLAPEHPLVEKITTTQHKSQVDEYIQATITPKSTFNVKLLTRKRPVFLPVDMPSIRSMAKKSRFGLPIMS